MAREIIFTRKFSDFPVLVDAYEDFACVEEMRRVKTVGLSNALLCAVIMDPS